MVRSTSSSHFPSLLLLVSVVSSPVPWALEQGRDGECMDTGHRSAGREIRCQKGDLIPPPDLIVQSPTRGVGGGTGKGEVGRLLSQKTFLPSLSPFSRCYKLFKTWSIREFRGNRDCESLRKIQNF